MRTTILHAAIVALTLPISVHALGLGDMKVNSYLDQPLLAEIELIDIGNIPLTSIRAELATEEEYERVGLKLPNIASQLNFTLSRNEQGRPIIKITSADRLTEPYLEIVVDLAWVDGEAFRAYTLLLDPPGYLLTSASPTHPLKVRHQEPGSVYQSAESHLVSVVSSHDDNRKESNYGPTLAQETIWQIAQHYKTSDLILPQLVLAIVGANPEAFTLGNLNGLKTGVRLHIPSSSRVLQVPANLAPQEIAAHDIAWQQKQPIEHVIAPPYASEQSSGAWPLVPSELNSASSIMKAPVFGKQPPNAIDTFMSRYIPVIAPAVQPELAQAPGTHKPQELAPLNQAALTIASSALESMRESNTILNEQLRLLQQQNKQLQQQMAKRDKDDKLLREQLKLLMKERQAVSGQVNALAPTGSHGFWLLWLVLFAASGAGYVLWRSRQSAEEAPLFAPSSEDKISTVRDEPDVIIAQEEPELPPTFSEINPEPEAPIAVEEACLVAPPTLEEPIEAPIAPPTPTPTPTQEANPTEQSNLPDSFEFESGLYDVSTHPKEILGVIPVADDHDLDFEVSPSPEKEPSDRSEDTVSVMAEAQERAPVDWEFSDKKPEEKNTPTAPALIIQKSSHALPSAPLKSKSALNTLLALAHTYISMGDVESARQSLIEVCAHGDLKQQEEANALLQGLDKDKQ